MEKILAWLWLADAVGSGCAYASELLALYPSPLALYEALRLGREAPPACLSARAAEKLTETAPRDFEARYEACRAAGAAILTPDSDFYPNRLRELPDLPLVLYVTGDKACLNGRRYVGMVGTRRPSAYGRQVTFDLSLEMAKQGAVIVSGLADGLDSEGHRAAVEAQAATVAFLGTPINRTYPAAHAGLRYQLERLGGAVCSEYPPVYLGCPRATFLARNRLIAGLSEVLCVAEAGVQSGTMNTVGHAERYGRPVLAVPGSIYSDRSQGTNELLRTHRADALCSAADVLDRMRLQNTAAAPAQSEFDPAQVGGDAKAVYAALKATPQTIDELCAATGLPAAAVLAACTELELFGGAVALPGRRYTANG